MNLPVLLNNYQNPENAVGDLIEAYRASLNEKPDHSQVSVWKSLTGEIISIADGFPSLAEFPIFNLERADYVILDTDRGLIIEAKGWKRVEQIDERIVRADGNLHLDPSYQLNNYVSKFNYFHSSGRHIKYKGLLFLYNNRTYIPQDCKIAHTMDELRSIIQDLRIPGNKEITDLVVNGRFHVSQDLIDLISLNRGDIMENASKTLLGRGYGLSEKQALLIHEVLNALKKGENRTFLVKGNSGSGKTLVAIELLLEAFVKKYRVFLAYRNNRLLNTLKQTLETRGGEYNLSPSILFYSTGFNNGIGEEKFSSKQYGNIDLVIYDEAQRMTEPVIRRTLERSTVKVYFYDDNQILIGDEAGTEENFLKLTDERTVYEFPSVFRLSRNYLKLVNHLIWGSEVPASSDYRVRIFDNIPEMFDDLNLIHSSGSKIALMCAFTESRGDMNNPTSADNRRIGSPLPSGLDIYKGTGLDVYWLMDPKTEYPAYWSGRMNPLERCASVYGSQGFETQFAGLVWGRDMIWRNGWIVNEGPITDNIGYNHSLKRLSKKEPHRALKLLQNRYYIMLTRGIRGIDLFFEDQETGEHVKSVLEANSMPYR